MDASVQRERLENVEHLLDSVEATGDEAADEHVEQARALFDSLRRIES